VTMMTVDLPHFKNWHKVFTHWGRILRGSDKKIAGIREYKDASKEERLIKEVNPAQFCFDSQWLWENINKIKDNNSQGEYYLTDLIEMAFEQGQPIATMCVAPEEAIGINTPEELEIAEGILRDRGE
jgi:bifunctional UDP-N-acetylglucosamine pyrophosphorylase / glucosamine-1-phosphate N-acetyltransferase